MVEMTVTGCASCYYDDNIPWALCEGREMRGAGLRGVTRRCYKHGVCWERCLKKVLSGVVTTGSVVLRSTL